MGMDYLIIVIIVLVIVILALFSNRIKAYKKADSIRSDIVEEHLKWSDKHQLTYGQIQDKKFALTKAVNEKFDDDTTEKEELINLIEDWAEFQIRAFEERRSWVRKPESSKQTQ